MVITWSNRSRSELRIRRGRGAKVRTIAILLGFRPVCLSPWRHRQLAIGQQSALQLLVGSFLRRHFGVAGGLCGRLLCLPMSLQGVADDLILGRIATGLHLVVHITL